MAACSNSNSSSSGHSTESRISLSSVSVFNWFLAVFFILFIVENPRSQFTVDTGRTNVTLASIDNVFLMQDRKDKFPDKINITPLLDLSLKLLTRTCLNVLHSDSSFSFVNEA